ncbi:MAG: hypothetical protein ACPF8V_02270 [Luteibaculum sp.]
MKTLRTFLIALVAGISFSACDVVIVHPDGPPGLPGRAFYGIDFDYRPPYSYWDNNPSVPVDPFFGEYYMSHPGYFEFEYFINREDYWYGSYELWINPGGPGRPYGEPGRNGADSYLLLICNPEGPYEWRKSNPDVELRITEEANGWITYEINDGEAGMRVKMKKTSLAERPSNKKPKFLGK